MRILISLILSQFLLFAACNPDAPEAQTGNPSGNDADLTGNSVTYSLESGSYWNINGSVVFEERKDGYTQVVISLKGLQGDGKFPVHLHPGDIGTEGAPVAALLQPISGTTGKSYTILKKFEDGTDIKYEDLKQMDGCIKIHLSSFGEGTQIVLAGGNIGSAFSKSAPTSRSGLAACSSGLSR